MKTGTHPRRCNFGLYIVVFARYVVLASTAITTYCLCYLVNQHRRHYCTWGYGTYCTTEQKKSIEVPRAEVIFIAAVRINLSLPPLHPLLLSPNLTNHSAYWRLSSPCSRLSTPSILGTGGWITSCCLYPYIQFCSHAPTFKCTQVSLYNSIPPCYSERAPIKKNVKAVPSFSYI
jgi:hypothetical protein